MFNNFFVSVYVYLIAVTMSKRNRSETPQQNNNKRIAGAFCEHGRRKPLCKACGGSAFCEHGRQKAHCKACGGSALCEHGHQKARCKDCKANMADVLANEGWNFKNL